MQFCFDGTSSLCRSKTSYITIVTVYSVMFEINNNNIVRAFKSQSVTLIRISFFE